MTETWKPIDFIDGIDADRYEVSDHGRVRSWWTKWGRRSTPKVMTGCLSPKDYPGVTLCEKGRNVHFKVHRLVAMAFIPNPEGKPEVAHNDGSKDNNYVSNLRWATRVENQGDRIAHGTHNRGENYGAAKLTETCVRKIRAMYAGGGVSQETLAKEFGVTRANIGCVIRRKSWDHVPDEGASQ